MSELREAAKAVVDAKDNPLNSIEDIEQVVERLRAALAQPEAEPPRDAYGNGRLIAAAPELYDALRELLTDMVIAQGNMRKAAKRDPAWEGCAEIIQPRVDAARAAIAKAEGK